ncbi:MAG: hypothetical protein ACJ79S_22350 [Gemmatimonadaceae bacterium]
MLRSPRRSRTGAGLALASVLLLGASACATGGGGATFLPPSRPAQFSFAGIPWGIPRDSVTALVEPRGYNFNRTDEDGDMWFDGVLYHAPARVYAFMADDRLVKFRVHIIAPDEDALSTYQSARAELIKQYGAPSETVEHYDAPYKQGDNRQLEALRKGKADIATYWPAGTGARKSYVSVRVTDKLTVVVDYEGPAWDRESVRRRRKAD